MATKLGKFDYGILPTSTVGRVINIVGFVLQMDHNVLPGNDPYKYNNAVHSIARGIHTYARNNNCKIELQRIRDYINNYMSMEDDPS